jgi:hypothetical protein
MMTRRVENVTCSRLVCPARPAASRFRRAFSVPTLARPPVSEPTGHPQAAGKRK